MPFLGSFVALLLAEGGRTGAGLDDDGVAGIITFILVTIASDTGGYVAGVLFGKHPMAPVISPKKSWEGFAGSIVFTIAAGIVLVVFLLDGDWWVGVALGADRGGHGHPRRPVRVGHQARPRHQGHEPGHPRPRRPDGPARLAAGHHRADLAAAALRRLLTLILFLVRHGRPLIDRARPAHEWELDPAGYDDIWALRTSGRLPAHAVWFSSPEPKALATAELLTDGEVGVVDGLREHVRDSTDWIEDFDDAVRRAFAVPDAVGRARAGSRSPPAATAWCGAVDGILPRTRDERRGPRRPRHRLDAAGGRADRHRARPRPVARA